MKALIDADLVAFINAASATGEPLWVAKSRANRMVRDILQFTGADEYELYLSGGINFRYSVNPNYKANRKKEDEPEHRAATEAYLIDEWGAIRTDGYEADDALGCAQTDNTIICSLDKDLRMIRGKHYSWPIIRKGKVVREASIVKVDPIVGLRWFYAQMLIGDTADNIFGIKGIGLVKASKLLGDCEDEHLMKNIVREHYLDQAAPDPSKELEDKNIAQFYMNANCLWIWRQLGETYSVREDTYG